MVVHAEEQSSRVYRIPAAGWSTSRRVFSVKRLSKAAGPGRGPSRPALASQRRRPLTTSMLPCSILKHACLDSPEGGRVPRHQNTRDTRTQGRPTEVSERLDANYHGWRRSLYELYRRVLWPAISRGWLEGENKFQGQDRRAHRLVSLFFPLRRGHCDAGTSLGLWNGVSSFRWVIQYWESCRRLRLSATVMDGVWPWLRRQAGRPRQSDVAFVPSGRGIHSKCLGLRTWSEHPARSARLKPSQADAVM